MANTNSPFGLSPIRRKDGAKWEDSAFDYYRPAYFTKPIFTGDPVVRQAGVASPSGQMQGVDLATFTANAAITGVLISTVGRATANAVTLTPSFWPPSSSGGAAYVPASTDHDTYLKVVDDPEVIFSVQISNTDVLPVSAIGKNATLEYSVGSAITGMSGVTLNANSVGNAGTLQVTILGFDTTQGNDPTQPYAKVLVSLNSSTQVNGAPGL